MISPQDVFIDVDEAANIAHIGIRRASLFMGLGLNAAHRKDFRDYQLSKLPMSSLPLEFFPRDLPDDHVDELKTEFGKWITSSGLRELTEHYSTFLNKMYFFALVISQHKSKVRATNPEALVQKFEFKGMTAKLKELKDNFGICPFESDSIISICTARNCLTHDHGIVLRKHYNQEQSFKLSWMALEIFAVGSETGEETLLSDLLNKVLTEDTMVRARVVLRSRELNQSDKLVISAQDLSEMCYFFHAHAIPSVTQSFLEFAKRSDVPISVSSS